MIRLERLRKELGMTRVALARQSGVDRLVIRDIEEGINRKYQSKTMTRLEEALGFKKEFFLEEEYKKMKIEDNKNALKKTYLCVSDIQRLFNTSRKTAQRIYRKANEIDNELDFRVEPKKVRINSVLKATGVTMNMLEHQRKMTNEQARSL